MAPKKGEYTGGLRISCSLFTPHGEEGQVYSIGVAAAFNNNKNAHPHKIPVCVFRGIIYYFPCPIPSQWGSCLLMMTNLIIRVSSVVCGFLGELFVFSYRLDHPEQKIQG